MVLDHVLYHFEIQLADDVDRLLFIHKEKGLSEYSYQEAKRLKTNSAESLPLSVVSELDSQTSISVIRRFFDRFF